MVEIRFPEVDLSNIKGVLLDIDNTLYPYEPAHRAATQALLDAINLTFSVDYSLDEFQEHYLIARKRVHTDLNTQGASHSRFLYIQKFLEGQFGKTDFANTISLEKVYWGCFLDHMQLDPKALSFVDQCFENEIAICCVTDLTAEIQFRKIIKLQLQDKIQYLVSSEESGKEKPHPYPFLLALEKLGIAAADAIMIGDSMAKDIVGAHHLGIKSHLVEVLTD